MLLASARCRCSPQHRIATRSLLSLSLSIMMLPLLLLSPFTSFSSSASQFQRMLFGTVTSTLRCSQTYTRAHTPLVDSSNFVCTGLVQAGSFDVCRKENR
ncbi:hypothetical protein CY35_03G040400 [Sphagnum magellanicum]|nr:hypothetical protein CY35_03G040400 [Sphagnum magellanicum]